MLDPTLDDISKLFSSVINLKLYSQLLMNDVDVFTKIFHDLYIKRSDEILNNNEKNLLQVYFTMMLKSLSRLGDYENILWDLFMKNFGDLNNNPASRYISKF